MYQAVIPVFLVILIGYLFGRKRRHGQEAEKLINEYVFCVALPVLLFLALARADPVDLRR